MIHKVKLDNGEAVELSLSNKQEDLIKPLPEKTKQKLYKLIAEKSIGDIKDFYMKKPQDPKKLLSLIAQGKLKNDSPFWLFEDLFEELKCPHCGKKFKK